MYGFQKSADGLALEKDGSVVTFLSGPMPHLYIGEGKAEFSMWHGSFRFRDQIKREIPLDASLEEERLVWRDQTGEAFLQAAFSQEKDCLKLAFEALRPGLNRLWIPVPAKPEEHIYGCGEQFAKFDLRGERVRIWVAEHQNATRIAKKIVREKLTGKHPGRKLEFSRYETYYAQPTFLSSRKYFLHVDTEAYTEFDFTNPGYHILHIHGIPTLYFAWEGEYETLMERLTDLLGRQPPLPQWANAGMILGIQGGTQAVEEKVARIKAAEGKVCGVWCQDWEGARKTAFGSQLMWNWAWDRETYPGLEEKVVQWKREGIHFLGYVNPFLAIEKELYRYASERGYCVKDRDGKDYQVTITTFPAAMVDLTNPQAWQWLKRVIQENLIDLGMGGWMADFGEYLPTDCVLYSGEDPALVHNRWPALWAQLNREAVEERGKLGEIFFFTRAGSTGTVRHSTLMWNGDQHVDWSLDDGMGSVIPASLSLSVCGFGLTHSDAGGYTTFSHMRRDKELMMRWTELCAFSPLMRSHEGNQPQANVQFDSDGDLVAHMARMSRIHHALAPYLDDCIRQSAARGTAVIRPLFWYYDEKRAYTEEQSYLLGRDLLVAPVLEQGAESRTVWLPQEDWVHLFTGEAYRGGVYEVKVPMGRPPVFVRRASPWLDTLLEIGQMA